MSIPESTRTALRAAMKAHGWSHEAVATALGGLSRQTVTTRLAGEGSCPPEVLRRWEALVETPGPKRPPPPCSLAGCEAPASARGLCKRHWQQAYERQRRGGVGTVRFACGHTRTYSYASPGEGRREAAELAGKRCAACSLGDMDIRTLAAEVRAILPVLSPPWLWESITGPASPEGEP